MQSVQLKRCYNLYWSNRSLNNYHTHNGSNDTIFDEQRPMLDQELT